MKEKELRESSVCGICHEKIGHSMAIRFFRVTVEQYILDFSAIQRQTGLAMMFGGNAAIAQAMGPDEDLAQQIYDPIRISLCDRCSIDHPLIWKILEEAR